MAEESEYKNFFETMQAFKIKQNQQKMNGINDYNMVNVVRKENAEVGMHSNVIFSLIDPDGLHYRGDLFLKLFIKDVLEMDDFGEILSVQAEEITTIDSAQNRRIDFTIKSSKYYIGIEMKVDAYDLVNQISDYEEDLVSKAKEDRKQKVIIYYLTKEGKEAGKHSSKNVIAKKISFNEHILKWITNCQIEVQNTTNLNLAFENYKDIVKKITGKYKGNLMSLEEFINEHKKDQDIIKLYKILDEIDAMQEDVARKFLTILMDSVGDTLDKKQGINFIDIVAGNYIIRLYFTGSELILQIGDINNRFQEIISDEKRKKFASSLLPWNGKFINLNWPKGYGEINLGKVRLQTKDKVIEKVKAIVSDIIKTV